MDWREREERRGGDNERGDGERGREKGKRQEMRNKDKGE